MPAFDSGFGKKVKYRLGHLLKKAGLGRSFRGYSDPKLFTGLASAALTECQATVSRAMQKVDPMASANISQLMLIRY